jgi:thioredoxin-related protein
MKNLFKSVVTLQACLLLSPLNLLAEEPTKEIKIESSNGDLVTAFPPKKGIVVYEWFNPECPFVKKIYKDNFMPKLQKEYVEKGVEWLVISSTNKSHQDFIPKEKRTELKAKFGIDKANMLYDEDGELGKTLGAKTTPNIMIYKDQVLAYSGAFDDSPDTDSNPAEAEHNYVKSALDSLLSGKPVEKEKTRPYGCSVKY